MKTLEHKFNVTQEHRASNAKEIDLRVGDQINSENKEELLWSGYKFGENKRTMRRGFYPSYKVRETWRLFDVPAFVL